MDSLGVESVHDAKTFFLKHAQNLCEIMPAPQNVSARVCDRVGALAPRKIRPLFYGEGRLLRGALVHAEGGMIAESPDGVIAAFALRNKASVNAKDKLKLLAVKPLTRRRGGGSGVRVWRGLIRHSGRVPFKDPQQKIGPTGRFRNSAAFTTSQSLEAGSG